MTQIKAGRYTPHTRYTWIFTKNQARYAYKRYAY